MSFLPASIVWIDVPLAILDADRGEGADRAAIATELASALSAALADPAVPAVVLWMSGAVAPRADATHPDPVPAGADIDDPVDGVDDPWTATVRALAAQIGAAGKPVLAALDGAVMDATFELALACHGRVATARSRVGCTAVHRGLIPAAGATQRLPRLIAPARALALLADGQPCAVTALADSGLFDVVVEASAARPPVVGEAGGGEPVSAPAPAPASALANADVDVDVDVDVDAALREAAARQAVARVVAASASPHGSGRGLDIAALHQALQARREGLSARQRLQPVHEALLQAVAASASASADGDPAVGLDRALAIARALAVGSAARALAHQDRAERAATGLPPALLGAVPRAVTRVAVIGAGTMGSGIAIATLDAGFGVCLLDREEAALQRGARRVADHYDSRVAAGKLDAAVAAERRARLRTSTAWTDLADADLVIEAVFEDLSVKQAVFREMDRHARPGAVLATNTSYLDIDAIAAVCARPQDVLGLHFFSPAHVMKLLEVVQAGRTAPEVLATGLAFGQRLGKVGVACGNAFGFIGNRIYNAYRRACEFMLEDGAWPEDVDQALTGAGFAMGPFAVADLSGLDIAWRMRQAQAAHRDPRERYVSILDRLCEQGRLGRKTGAGYYAYTDGRASPRSDDTVRAVITAARAERGRPLQTLTPERIVRRALLAMVNEAALLLAEGVAARPGDVDVVLVQGYGFPRWCGGPVFWALQQDPATLEAELRQLAVEAGYGFRQGDLSVLGLAPLVRDRPKAS